MKNILWIALIIGILLGLLIPGLSCTKTVYVTPTSTPTSETQQVVARCISAMKQVDSYKLDTDVVNVYKVIDGANNGTDTTEWSGTQIVSIAGKKMGLNMTIDEGGAYSPVGGDNWSTEMYVIDGWEYYKATSPHVVNLSPSPPNPWEKNKLTNELWAKETQITFYTELLKTATESDLLGNATVNGVDCYILDIVPSTQAIIDWVVSQDQPFGPQIDIMFGGAGPVVRAEAYQGGSVKLWISQESYLPLKVEVNADFQGNVGGGMILPGTTPYIPTTNPVNSSFDGQMTFSEYNQPVSIQLPQEAIGAQEYEIQ